jgi:iron complex outermembrane receptor protein
MIKQFFLICLLLPLTTFSQIKGKVIDNETNDIIIGAKITTSNGEKTISDINGSFSINAAIFPLSIYISMPTYLTDTLRVEQKGEYMIRLQVEVKAIESVVVTANRHAQKVEDVAVSMEILKPALINNKGITDLEQAVDQSPGVYAMDGQVSIRGGGGYSYGAGSRVLLLWNGIPMMSPDIGDAKWNSIPMENASQIEIIKGASSVLYGSGALNGIISLNEKDPDKKGSFQAKVQSGFYCDPKRESLKWWKTNPTYHSFDVFYGKMRNRFGYTVSANGYTNQGYRKGEVEDRARISGSFLFKPKKIENLRTGLFYNFQYQYMGAFILWESDSLGYTAQGGDDPKSSSSTISYQKSIRATVDPYVKYTDKHNNKHELKTRYYLVTTGNLSNIYASSKAELYYANYQFQKQFKNKSSVILGSSLSSNQIVSSVFGNHGSINSGTYAQYELKLKKLEVTVGGRVEYFKQDDREPDSKRKIGKTEIPVYPIIRSAVHYKLAKYTHLRASFGQGIRFPSVAERFAATSSGGVVIFPNPSVKPETGWAAEIGVKQVVKIGDWKGMIDVAGFVNQYDNMMEYTFGIYNPDTVALTADNFTDWVGFKSKNSEKARITGVEFSFNSQGKIRNVEIISLIGYTYMNPISLNTKPEYVAMFSDSTTNILKYRFKHLAKADIEFNYKKFSLGFSCRYNSYMRNIDKVFEVDLDPTANELYVLPGLKQYRLNHQEGSLVFDSRIGYTVKEKLRIGLIVNNIFNTEYVSRPADIQPPRTIILQLQYKFNG